MSKKKVFVTGVTGMDGSHMVDYLLSKTDCTVYGGVRRVASKGHNYIDAHKDNPRFNTVLFDLADPFVIDKVVSSIRPDYFINFAANSFVGDSWSTPALHYKYNTEGVLNILEAIRRHSPKTVFYNAGSSEEFGDVVYSPQDLAHPLRPRSPYGASKASARHIVKVYRESYGIRAYQAFCFNHESERRGEEFVTRKISKGVARIYRALDNHEPFKPIELGNVDARRDWSYAPDFIEGIWALVNERIYDPRNCDVIFSSGRTNSVREFVSLAFAAAGIRGTWVGKGEDEKYVGDSSEEEVLVKINPEFYRPAEVHLLLGDNSSVKKLGWTPKTSFEDLVKIMVQKDIENEYQQYYIH